MIVPFYLHFNEGGFGALAGYSFSIFL